MAVGSSQGLAETEHNFVGTSGFEVVEDGFLAGLLSGSYEKFVFQPGKLSYSFGNGSTHHEAGAKDVFRRLGYFSARLRASKPESIQTKSRIFVKCLADVLCASTSLILTERDPLGIIVTYYKNPVGHQWLVIDFKDVPIETLFSTSSK